MRYSHILAIGSVFGSVYERDIFQSIKNGVIRHFDHITDLPTTPWYRVPQNNETYKSFQKDQFENAIQCDQSLAKVAYTVKDPYEADPSNPLVRIVSNLKWPQVDGKLLKNVYPPYVSIHGGIRQFCVLRRYFAKTVDGRPDQPRDREWGPYRCSKRNNEGSYDKFLAIRSGPDRKYKSVINLVDIRGQADWFGPMYTKLSLDSEESHPKGMWSNNRPIVNYLRNDIIEKYNVEKFYNSEHELFNDNSRLRLVGLDMIKYKDATRTGKITEVDTMMPTYALISGQPYGTSIFSVDVDDWHIRNIVPNYIERTFKGGFMKTGSLLSTIDNEMIVGMDVDASNRYCCSNNAGGYEGYNREDSRKKAVGYMFQPTFAPFWLWRTATTCKSATDSCTETYGSWWGTAVDDVLLTKDAKNAYFPTASDSAAEKLDGKNPDKVEEKIYKYFYGGNPKELYKGSTFEATFGKNYYKSLTANFGTDHLMTKNRYWDADSKMFGCTGTEADTIVTVNYACSVNQYLRNNQEVTDSISYNSQFPDYQDAWKKSPYAENVGMKNDGFMTDVFENDISYRDFEHFAPRFKDIDCNVPVNNKEPNVKQCQFNTIKPDTIDFSYGYNQYFSSEQYKHTITDIKQTTLNDCKTIQIDVEVDCGKTTDATPVWDDTSNFETNYWAYAKKCSGKSWDEVYSVMFPTKVGEETGSIWKAHLRSEYTKTTQSM